VNFASKLHKLHQEQTKILLTTLYLRLKISTFVQMFPPCRKAKKLKGGKEK
jgi:hypothetical protein